MNKIPPLRLPSITAEALVEGVILEPKKGQTLSEEDCRALHAWLDGAVGINSVLIGTTTTVCNQLVGFGNNPNAGRIDANERCKHGVRWENRCGSCYPETPALMGAGHGFELYP